MVLSPGESPGSFLQPAIGHNNHRIFSSKFQRYRSEVLCCSFHYNPSNLGTSCEKDLIEFVLKQLGGLVDSTLLYIKKFAGKVCVDQISKGFRSVE